MLIPAVLLLAALGSAPPGSKAGAGVVLEARAVVIPPLPHSVAEARKHYARVRKVLEASYRDSEAYLAACNQELAAPVEARITIPLAFAAEARNLGHYLYDATYLTLEEPLLDRWNAWQNALLAQGMAEPREAQRTADSMLLLSSSKPEILGRARSGQTPLEVVCEDPASPDPVILTLPRRVSFIEVLAMDRMIYGANTDFGERAKAFADQQAALLAEDWEPLTTHLNSGALALLELDRTAVPTRDPGIRALRLLARIHFMERFRSTLWFCQVVWAHLASERILPIRQM